MWDIFDQWIVLLALFWALWIIYRSLSKKSFLSCNSPCEKKIFDKKDALVNVKRKFHA
jgi:hypothetical protein